jgi:hypothetical protein
MSYEPPQRFYGGLAFGLYESTPNAPLFSVLNVVDTIVDLGAHTLTVTCTTRAMAVLAVELTAVNDVRRVIVPEDGVAAVELDLQVFEASSAVGPQWKTYVATIASIRVDAGLIAALFTSAVHYQRKALSMQSGAIPRMLIAPVISAGPNGSSRVGGGGGGGAFGGQDAELAIIRQRRSERQRRLVNAMMLGFSVAGDPSSHSSGMSGGSSALSGRSLFDSEALLTSSNPAGGSLGAGGGGASDALLDAHWCRWCNEYVPHATHLKVCLNRPVECSWCGERMKAKTFESHKFECGAAEQRAAHMVGANDPRLMISNQGRGRNAREADTPSPAPAAASSWRRESIDQTDDGDDDDDKRSRGKSSEPEGDHECMWCHKMRDKAHQKECPMREVLCRRCHQTVAIKDKKSHRLTCSRAAADGNATSALSKDTSAVSSPASTPRAGGKPSVRFSGQ